MYPNNENKPYYSQQEPPPPPPPPPVPTEIPVKTNNQYNYPQSESSAFYVDSQHQEPANWSTGLCHCCDDPTNCMVTCCCPCITFGQIAEIVDRGSTSCGASGALYTLISCLTGCQCIYSCSYRQKMRAQYSLAASPCHDCLVHCFCGSCALCQEYRELKRRGFDMSIGWQGNMERQGRGPANVPPTVPGGMTR